MNGINEIKQITLGALRVYEKDGYVCFSRFTEKQEKDLWDYGCGTKIYGTSNIRLEFWTKGGELSFDYEITPGTVREYYSIDLKVDGVYRYGINKDTNEDKATFTYSVPSFDQMQRVTVYFPATACLKLKNLSLPADFKPHNRTLKILTLGDSLVQGYHPNHFSNTFMNIVADELYANMVNQAVGGDCFRRENVYIADGFDPDFITVAYGINDWASYRLGNGEEAHAYLEALTSLYPDKRIFLTLPCDNKYIEENIKNEDIIKQDTGENKNRVSTLKEVRQILAKVAADFPNVTCINAKDFVPCYEDCYFADKVHFTDLGNVFYAIGYTKEIKKYIEV